MRDDRSDGPTITRRGTGPLRGLPATAVGVASGPVSVAGAAAMAAEKDGARRDQRDAENRGDRDDGDGRTTPDARDGEAAGRRAEGDNGPERQRASQDAERGEGGQRVRDGGGDDRERRTERQDTDDDETIDGLGDRVRAALEDAAEQRRAAEGLADRLLPSDAADDAEDEVEDEPVDIDLDIADDGDVTVDVALNVPGLDGPPDVEVNIPDLPGFGEEEAGNAAIARAGDTIAIAGTDGGTEDGGDDVDFAS